MATLSTSLALNMNSAQCCGVATFVFQDVDRCACLIGQCKVGIGYVSLPGQSGNYPIRVRASTARHLPFGPGGLCSRLGTLLASSLIVRRIVLLRLPTTQAVSFLKYSPFGMCNLTAIAGTSDVDCLTSQLHLGMVSSSSERAS